MKPISKHSERGDALTVHKDADPRNKSLAASVTDNQQTSTEVSTEVSTKTTHDIPRPYGTEEQSVTDLAIAEITKGHVFHVKEVYFFGDGSFMELIGRNIDGRGEILLGGIHVPWDARKRGRGSELLKMLCEQADVFDLSIALSVERFGSARQDALTVRQLKDWYKRHGFVLIKGSNRAMRRERKTDR